MSEPSGVWALGDLARVVRETIGSTGAELTAACGVGRGQRVLDVGAGTGNVALPAARAGAQVVASDIVPELLAIGRAEAEQEGLRLQWVQGDAQALPFVDNAFDVVLSSFGAMFAPDQPQTAAELLRVCRPNGTLGLQSWTPEGWTGEFFATISSFLPPPPEEFRAPALWGSEPHLRELLGDGLADLRTERCTVVIDRFDEPQELVAYYRANFGPLIAAHRSLADDPDSAAALDEALLDFAQRSNSASAKQGGTRYELEYLRAIAQVAA